ncbi:T9SS type A sorting domain-containing protein [Aquimarina sp. RZ0]|uniref:T9SS type A sorting domain-containing protein n=1 Tax=Aquimarina sp. RZ0 TaxID=2607730 RepID=UPI0011F2F610|nr:T9SS type A sorting domain-containing protein [Aquimarina sp. RZ0]KAA1247290.1 T9SS type A sorting domain-containing protein [Aquimarina sp. RZ0]
MKKVKLLLPLSIALVSLIVLVTYFSKTENNIDQAKKELIPIKLEGKKKKKTPEERRRFTEERLLHELNLQRNPSTGKIPLEEKQQEIISSKNIMLKTFAKNVSNTSYISRGPSNLGGRTRSLVIDRSDATGNTMISGGVSSGVFRTTDGGSSWAKVSPNNQIHNVTTIAQDQRAGSENIWYYGTGEAQGNSASATGAFFLGQGIWQSTDSGLSWTQVPSTASTQEEFDSPFDIVSKIAVHPITGDLYAATLGVIRRFDGTDWTVELDAGANLFSDMIITSNGTVYAAFSGSSADFGGVWQSSTGVAPFTRIGSSTTPGFSAIGRIVLAVAPSNEDIVYALYVSSNDQLAVQAGIWQWNDSTDVWTDYTAKMPDEPNPDPSNPDAVADLPGNDPIAVQGGYDLVVSVKPDDENFVVIGGTNAYKIEDITTDPTFVRIGGYINNQSYGLYNLGGGDTHHPDIHALVFDSDNTDILISGTDGGIHRTNDIGATTVSWTNLNNNYQTYQYYHVATDPDASSNIVIGGAQDNGTTAGGFPDSPDLTTMGTVAGGDGVAVAVSRDDACVPFFLGVQNGVIFRDCPVGAEITPDGSSSQFVTYFYLDPSNNNALYYAGQADLYRTTESSTVTTTTWTNLGDFGGISGNAGETIRQMAATWGTYDASSSYLLIGGNQGSLLRLNDPQNAIRFFFATNITPPGATGTVSGIAVHPTNNDIAMVTYSNYGITNIYVTTNATAATPSWTVAERNLDTFSIRSAAITEVDGETRYFVGTARGLYSSIDPVNEDWVIEAPNQVGFALVSALAYKPSNDKLLVGTHGNGMYEATITPTTLSVDESNSTDTGFVAYPIPTSDVINIVLEDSFTSGDLEYTIFGINGRQIKSEVLNDQKQIAVNDLAKGSYILQLSSANKNKAIIFTKN